MKLFSRSKESSDPSIIINNCLKAVANRISDSLDEDEYHWMKPWGVKRFESIILAKFMLDYSFNQLAEDKLGDDERIGYHNLCDISFSNVYNCQCCASFFIFVIILILLILIFTYSFLIIIFLEFS